MPLDLWKTNGICWNILIQKLIELQELLFFMFFTTIVFFYILHNYCLKWDALEPSPPNVATLQKKFQAFANKLPIRDCKGWRKKSQICFVWTTVDWQPN